ncbi:hypothetical protein V8B97DRAFT_674752 [Scleroderma yunnanense]
MSYRPPKKRTIWQPIGPPRSVNDQFLLQDLDGVVETLSVDATVHSSSTFRLRNLTPIASYSWIEGTPPVIAVPGYPRIWKSTPPSRVPADSGVHYVDRNASHMGHRSPLVPIFSAIDTLHENFPYKDLDLITDRNNLRKMLRCIDQQSERAFRIDIELAGKTCLLTRREDVMMETINDFRGYGHEYEKAATKSRRGSEEEIGHHRIVTYDFGGIHVLLRCTVDACTEFESEDDDILASFSALNIGGQAETPKSQPDSTYINRFGIKMKLTSPRSVVPQSRLIEIKTRSSHRELDWKEAYPQLFLSQTPYLYLAKHTKGTFGIVEKVDVNGQAMVPHAKEAENAMGKLEILLGSILKAVRKQGEGKPLSLVYFEGKLKLYKRKEGSGKPIDVEISKKFRLGTT